MEMNLTVVNHEGTLVADSRDVAKLIGKRHDNLVRDINGYIQIMEKEAETLMESESSKLRNRAETLTEAESAKLRSRKIDPSDFFIPSTYRIEGNFKEYPCYLLTKQGCEMVANKLTGEKGILFTAAYVQQFNTMEKFIKGEKLEADEKLVIQRMKAEAALKNANARQAALWAKFADMLEEKPHKHLCAAYGTQVLTGGEMVLPMPEMEKTYSAEEVGAMFGISGQRVGRLANLHGLKTVEYGYLALDKSRYSSKEVETWRYNQAGIDKIREILGEEDRIPKVR